MGRQRLSGAINLIMTGIICGIFGALGTYAIYDIIPSDYFTQYQRYIIGAFVSCCVVSIIVLGTSRQMCGVKVQSND